MTSREGRRIALKGEALSKSFGGLRAVDGMSFEVEEGSLSALIGPNGAGKSTLVGLISGALRPDAGRIWLGERDVTGWPAHKIAQAGLVRTFQLSREFGGLTVMENLLVTPKHQPGESLWNVFFWPRRVEEAEQRYLKEASEVLVSYGLWEVRNHLARELSGGQKRLLELARAVMARPRILLLDEPMAGVSPVLVERLCRHIVELRDLGTTILMVEHNLNIVEAICERVIVMAEGHSLATGTMSELRANPDVVRAYLGGALVGGASR